MGVRSPRRKRHSQSPRRRTASNVSNDNDGDSDEYEDVLVPPPDVPQFAQTYAEDKRSISLGKPLPFITFHQESNTLAIDPQALACIANIAHPIAIVAIAGLYRTGKSSLLNWLLSPSETFPVASTIERCTHGIWLYPSPIMWTTSNQENVAVLFLDTEGLGGLKASQENDVKIFSLTALLSSKLIYNSQGSIDEKAIHGLSFIANLAKHIRLNTKESGSDSDEILRLHAVFPSFLWLVRDFALELVDEDGDPISSSEYLEQALAEQMPRVPANMERNRLRAMMKEFFRERDCMTLIRPVLDEEELQQSDLSLQTLRPEFQVQIEQLRKLVFDEKTLKPKSIQETVMNGSMFAGLVQAYVDSINGGSVPVVSSAWQSIAESESRKARENAMEMYRTAVSTLEVPLEPNVLAQTLKELGRNGLMMFEKRSMGEFAEKMKKELQQHFASEKMKMIDRNEKACREMCQLLLQKLYSDIVQPLLIEGSGSPYSEDCDCASDFECLDEKWAQFRDTYLAQAFGSTKLENLMSFSESKYSEALRSIVMRREENFEKKIRLLESDIANVKEQLGAAMAREQTYQEEMEKIQSVSSEVLSEKSRLEAENRENQSQMAHLESKLASYQFSRQETQISKEAADLQFEFMTKRHKEVDNELAVMKAQYERILQEKEAQAQKLNALTQESENVASIQTCACVVS